MTTTAELPATEPAAPRQPGSQARVILVIDDEPNIRRLLTHKLERSGYETIEAGSGEEALGQLDGVVPDLVLLDLRLPGMQGLEVLECMRSRSPGLPVIVLTAEGSVETAVEAMKLGARDFLTKPLETERLEIAVRNALEIQELALTVDRLKMELTDLGQKQGGIVGRNGGLRETFLLLEKVVPTDLTVLLEGESGTGKEVLAQAIHREGRQRGSEFQAINCAALPDTLLESELFGYVKGAFTGADCDRPGRFEAAEGGTLLLDEISEMSAVLQSKLLRVVQECAVTRLGCTKSTPIDVRIICATNKNLEQEVQDGRFREDLFYRIAVFPITIPPLRKRKGDIPAFCEHILSLARPQGPPAVHPRTMELLETYDWPGNVRELQNVLRRAVVLSGGQTILPEHLTSPVQAAIADALTRPATGGDSFADETAANGRGFGFSPVATLDDVERGHILGAMEQCSGNMSRTARLLGIGRTTLYRKLERYGLRARAT